MATTNGVNVGGERILIVGPGGLGTLIGGYLARAGVDVTLLMRAERAQAFARPEVHVGGIAEFVTPVRIASDPVTLGRFDYLILCVKARDTAAALEPLRHLPVETVLSLQNGAGKDQALAQIFGPERVLGAVTMAAGSLEEPGFALHTHAGATQFGELDGRPSARGAQLAEILCAAGLPAACVPNILTLVWFKLAVFLRSALVGALARLDVASIALDPDLCSVAAGVVHDLATVAAAEGHPLPRATEGQPPLATTAFQSPPGSLLDATTEEIMAAFSSFGRAVYESGVLLHVSLVRDVLAGRPTELDATAGDALARADRHGLPVPSLRLCTRLLRGAERVRCG